MKNWPILLCGSAILVHGIVTMSIGSQFSIPDLFTLGLIFLIAGIGLMIVWVISMIFFREKKPGHQTAPAAAASLLGLIFFG